MAEVISQGQSTVGTTPQDAEASKGFKELQSENGQRYGVKADDYDIADEAARVEASGDAPAASGPAFDNVQVYWTVGSEGAPSQDVQNKTSITWYKLGKAPWWSIYTYELTIVAKDTYDFFFTDASPDTYELNVYQNAGSHYVQYSSSNPTIVSISGK